MMGGHGSAVHMIVKKDAGINRIDDIKGKRVGTGAPGADMAIVQHILQGYGLEIEKDYKPMWLSFSEQVKALKDGHLDVAFIHVAIPNAGIMDLVFTHDIRFLSMDKEIAEKVCEKHRYYYPDVIPANSYKDQAQDVLTLGNNGGLFTHKDVSADLVYRIMEVLYDHNDELAAVHKAGNAWIPQNAMRGIIVPFHPGAEKCLKERGILK
jgi:TRAP transporter TAXI family solute receptor